MENNFQAFFQKAKKVAETGAKKAGEAVTLVANEIGEGIESVKENKAKVTFAGTILVEIMQCIDELEETNKADTYEEIHKEQESLINELNALTTLVKSDPYNCEEAINNAVEKYANKLEDIHSAYDNPMTMQVMQKNYEEALKACKDASRRFEKEAEKVKKIEAEKNAPLIIEVPKTEIKLLLPLGYQKLEKKNLLKRFLKNNSNKALVYRKTTSRSDSAIMIEKTAAELAMPFDDPQTIIDGIHDCLEDNQGLIEVHSGKTKRGYDYIYTIVKTLREEFKGVIYFLRMNIRYEDDILEIQAPFEEQGVTGERDSFCFALAQNADLVSTDDMKGWNEDPYDSGYTHGVPMNLSERSSVDGLFPSHPLSQAREVVMALIEDKYVVSKEEKEQDDQSGNVAETEAYFEENYKDNMQQFYLDLFSKESVLGRHTIDIDIS